ncbi:MAG TPA: DUF6064 family protein [Ramlibacter sp.]|jgi:hypothetical protein|nr:DUF6064 family protein [Ramlibacter sp.]
MSEWWTYSLSDFLMFSPQAYWRLVARYNAAWWPGQLAGVAAALAVVALLRVQRSRIVLPMLAIAWAWVGGAFHWQRYTEIFPAAQWLAAAALAQALLLALMALLPREERPQAPAAFPLALAALACAWPLLAPVTGHPWSEAEVFGFMPEPTALLTVAALLALRDQPTWRRVVAGVLPAASLLLGAATRWLIAQ